MRNDDVDFVSKKARKQGDATIHVGEWLCFLCGTARADLHGSLDQDRTLTCTFSKGGLTTTFVFDPLIACVGNLKQHLHSQCSTTNGSTSPGTIAANIGGTQYGVSGHKFPGTRSWKKQSGKGISGKVKRS